MKNFIYLMMVLVFIGVVNGCSKEEEPDEIVKKEIISIGDTILKVEEVYGQPDAKGSFSYEEAGFAVTGYSWMYFDLDLHKLSFQS